MFQLFNGSFDRTNTAAQDPDVVNINVEVYFRRGARRPKDRGFASILQNPRVPKGSCLSCGPLVGSLGKIQAPTESLTQAASARVNSVERPKKLTLDAVAFKAYKLSGHRFPTEITGQTNGHPIPMEAILNIKEPQGQRQLKAITGVQVSFSGQLNFNFTKALSSHQAHTRRHFKNSIWPPGISYHAQLGSIRFPYKENSNMS